MPRRDQQATTGGLRDAVAAEIEQQSLRFANATEQAETRWASRKPAEIAARAEQRRQDGRDQAADVLAGGPLYLHSDIVWRALLHAGATKLADQISRVTHTYRDHAVWFLLDDHDELHLALDHQPEAA